MSPQNSPSPSEASRERGAHLLLMRLVRDVVEKHGGSMEIDPKSNTAVLGIPDSKKAACFEELEEIIGRSEPFKDLFRFLH